MGIYWHKELRTGFRCGLTQGSNNVEDKQISPILGWLCSPVHSVPVLFSGSEWLVEAAAPGSQPPGFKFNERKREILSGSCSTSPGIQRLDHLGSCTHFWISHSGLGDEDVLMGLGWATCSSLSHRNWECGSETEVLHPRRSSKTARPGCPPAPMWESSADTRTSLRAVFHNLVWLNLHPPYPM